MLSASTDVILNRHFELLHPGPGCKFEIAVNSRISFVRIGVRFSTNPIQYSILGPSYKFELRD